MRLLLVRPPFHNPRLAPFYTSEPLSLESLAAATGGAEVRIVDGHVDPALDRTLEDFAPDVVGIGGYTADVPRMLAIADEVKRQAPRAFVVVGGHHAGVAPEDFARPSIDAAVVGPGEATLAALLAALERRTGLADVAGLALPEGGAMRRTAPRPPPESLDEHPLPRRDLTERYEDKYRALGHPFAVVNTARGCPYRCRFCAIVREMGGRYIVKSADRVVEELASLPQTYVRFADGNTFGNRRRVEELRDAFLGARLGKRFMIDARADAIVRFADALAGWRDAGLEWVAVGFESVRPERLEALGKDATVEDNARAIDVLHDLGLKIVGQFMIDPDFTLDDFARLLDFVRERQIHLPSFLITTPLPGTPLHAERRAELTTADLARLDCLHAVTPTRLPIEDFYRQFVRLYEETWSWRRVATSLRERLRGRGRDLPPWLLAAVRLYALANGRRFKSEYGLG